MEFYFLGNFNVTVPVVKTSKSCNQGFLADQGTQNSKENSSAKITATDVRSVKSTL